VAPDNSLSSNIYTHSSFTNTSPHPSHNNKNTNTRTNMASDTLPTPVKTPSKKAVPDANLASRVLFQDQPSAIPEPANRQKKMGKGKKYSAFSLESFNEGDNSQTQNSLSIFTDSRDKIPELDESEGNPFSQKPDSSDKPEVSTNTNIRSTKRRKVNENGNTERDKDVQEALHRDDGMYYNL
jgi:hypothetical protein